MAANITTTTNQESYEARQALLADPLISAIWDHAEAMGNLNRQGLFDELSDADFSDEHAIEICDILLPVPVEMTECANYDDFVWPF